MWNALVAREKGVRGIYSLRSWSPQIYKILQSGKEFKPKLQNTHIHTNTERDHYSKTTTAPQRGRLGREPAEKSQRAGERTREQQEQTHSLIKGGSLKISQETLLFLFWSQQKSSVPREFRAKCLFNTTFKKMSLIVKMHNYCRWKKVSHLPHDNLL